MSIQALIESLEDGSASSYALQTKELVRDLRLLADALESNGSHAEFAREANAVLGSKTNAAMNKFFDRLQDRLTLVYANVRLEYLERQQISKAGKP